MRFHVVSHHLPELEGSAAGRVLLATCEGLLELGHEVDVVSWTPTPPEGALPPWCEWRPLRRPRSSRWASALHPRREAAELSTSLPDDVVAVADDVLSFAAVASHPRSVVTFHHLARLDGRGPRTVQDTRADRWAAREASVALTYSSRVAEVIGAVTVPIAIPIPSTAVGRVEAPTAALVADWRWPPNRVALERLLRAWPSVRERVAGARLVLAGRGMAAGEITGDGVTMLGPVSRTADVLAEAAVVAFPCPDTSGPKVKVLEAMAHGVAVVTTAAGVEGVVGPAGVVVATEATFAEALAGALTADGDLGAAGRAAVVAHHAPAAAATARVDALVHTIG